MPQSHLEAKFIALWTIINPDLDLMSEVKMIPCRQFRFDFYHWDTRTAIEINGGTYNNEVKSRHATGVGLDGDYTKNNLAIINNIVVFQLSTKMITEYWVKLIGNYIRAKK